MIIKTFRANTSSAALKEVREQMGGDAIVLKSVQTYDEQNRIVFEITACVEKPSVSQTSKIFPNKSAATAVAENSEKQPVAEQTVKPVSIPKVEQRIEQKPIITAPVNAVDDTLTVKLDGIESMLSKLLNTNTQTTEDITPDPTQLDMVRQILTQHDFSPVFTDLFLASLEDE